MGKLVDHPYKIEIPTLILAAHKERLTKPEASIEMNQNKSGLMLITLMPAGHMGLWNVIVKLIKQ